MQPHPRHRFSCWPLCAVPLLLALLGAAPTSKARTRTSAPSVQPMLTYELAGMERQMAARLLKRAGANEQTKWRLEVEIDLRVLIRWAFAAAQAAKSESDLQAAAWLRSQLFVDATAAVEAALDSGTGQPSKAQGDAATQLHQLAGALTDGASATELDQVSRRFSAILVAFTSTQAGTLPRGMRPQPLPAVRNRSATTSAAPRTIRQLAEQAQRLNVSPTLRTQILELARLAAAPAATEGESRFLELAVDLAQGISAGTATPQIRASLETQLTDGLVLYLDTRTHGAGRNRLLALRRYQQFSARLGQLELKENLRSALSPLLALVHGHPEASRTMGVVEGFAQQRNRLDKRPRQTASLAGLRKPTEEVEKLAEQSTTQFLSLVAEIPQSGLSLADLEREVDEMRRAVDLLERLDQAPAALEALQAFKPRPAGALEKRLLAAAAAVGTGKPTDASRWLEDFLRLAQIASDLSAMGPLPAAVDKHWAGGQMAAADAKWRSLVSDLISSPDIDRLRLGRLAALLGLVRALHQAGPAEALCEDRTALVRWVDWRLQPASVRLLLWPCAQATRDALAGFIGDSSAAMDRFAKSWARLGPILTLATQTAQYQEQCASLPSGLEGLVASLATPMEGAAFAAQRQAAWAAANCAWCVTSGNKDDVDDVAMALGRRLAAEFGIE